MAISTSYTVLGDHDGTASVNIFNVWLLAHVPSRAGRLMLCRVFIFAADLGDIYSN